MSRSHGSGANHFSISQADFERESLLKRRQQPSPRQSPGRLAEPPASTEGTIAFRRPRSKSKSRGRESVLQRLPSMSGQEFIPLGRAGRVAPPVRRSPSTRREPRATIVPPQSPSTRREPVEDRGRKRTLSTSARAHEDDDSERRRPSKAQTRETDRSRRESPVAVTRKRTSSRRSPSRSPSRSRKASRSSASRRRSSSSSVDRTSRESNRPSKARASSSSDHRAVPGAGDQELQRDIERKESDLKQAKKDLAALEAQLAQLQRDVDAKKYAVMDLQIVVDGLHKRRALQQQFLRKDSSLSTSSAPAPSPERQSSSRSSSKRRPIVMDEEEEDDSDVEIIERPVKDEPSTMKSSSWPSSSRQPPTPHPTVDAASSTASQPALVAKKSPVHEMSDYFWGRVDIAKLLVQPRIRCIPDGSNRKGRHLVFNPRQQDVFATGSDDGGLILWNYSRHKQEVAKVVSFDPTSFRKTNQCAESVAWSPDGMRLAIAFRDPVQDMGEFCVARLHNLALSDSPAPQVLPRDRLKTKSTTLHPRGISAIEWVPSGHSGGARGLVTAGSDHGVVLWEEHDGQSDFKWSVLHREHRSDIRSICVHSQGSTIYTGALDGLVVRYDLQAQRAHTVMERRRPSISKINAVLENPHNPHLLMVSSVEQSEHNLLLHDLRERYSDKRQSTMTLSWLRSSDSKAMSQYIVPRWSSGGFHVSCGSTSGTVNIWDVRVRGPKYPLVLPQQSINVHQKQVLHATWHPRYDAMFSVSNDRTIGLLTFR